MRKLLAVAVVCLLISSVTSAQKIKQKAVFGFKAGANVSTFRTAVDYTDFDPALKVGYVLGGFVDIPIGSSRFSLQPNFLYSQMGSKGSSSQWGTVKFRYNYVSFPLLVKFKAAENFYILAGPQADFLTRARQKDFFKTTTITNDIRDYDLGFSAGIETSFSKKVTLGARYIHGIRDVSRISDHFSFYNQGIQVAVGYKLFPKPKKAKTK